MHDHKTIKSVVIMSLIVIGILVTGIIVLANDSIKFTAPSPQGRWKVEFTSIAEGEIIGGASSKHRPEYTGTYASFYAVLMAPGDSITYDMQVSNLGNMDAVLADIDWITSPNKKDIKYELMDLNRGYILKAGTSKNFKVKVSYDKNATEVVSYNKPISIVLSFVQYH